MKITGERIKHGLVISVAAVVLAACSEPVSPNDRGYRGFDVEVGVQGRQAFPVEAAIRTDEDFAVRLNPDQMAPMPVEVVNADRPLTVAFELPPLPRSLLAALSIAVAVCSVTSIFALAASVSARNAAKHAREAAEHSKDKNK